MNITIIIAESHDDVDDDVEVHYFIDSEESIISGLFKGVQGDGDDDDDVWMMCADDELCSQHWVGPFVMAMVMANCVRHSHCLNHYSDKLIYRWTLMMTMMMIMHDPSSSCSSSAMKHMLLLIIMMTLIITTSAPDRLRVCRLLRPL